MKYGIISIILNLIGISLFCYGSYEIAENLLTSLQNNVENNQSYISSKATLQVNRLYDYASISIVIIGAIFGYLSIRKKSFYGYVGLILAIIYILLSYSNFVLKILLSDSALDINIS